MHTKYKVHKGYSSPAEKSKRVGFFVGNFMIALHFLVIGMEFSERATFVILGIVRLFEK